MLVNEKKKKKKETEKREWARNKPKISHTYEKEERRKTKHTVNVQNYQKN
jgi:hypothetical protein